MARKRASSNRRRSSSSKPAVAEEAANPSANGPAKAGALADHKQLELLDEKEASTGLGAEDQKAFAVLVVLYFLQGIPAGLAFGTMPFLLKARLSYSDVGIFMLCTYPYSLKFFWCPIVDSWFVRSLRTPLGTLSLGRRKSWIVPIQLIVGVMLWLLADNVDALLNASRPNVWLITGLFFALVFFVATQDIAVDGWALTLLSEENLSYASTAQTVGLNTGYFLSFTVFLAFNSIEFSNKYFRATPLEYPLLSLHAYLKASSVAFIVVTTWLLLFYEEDPENRDVAEMDTMDVYSQISKICKLKHVQLFLVLHMVSKIGFQANDAVTQLKLVEKGLGKEDLALAVLIDFPFQMILGYLAAKWSKGSQPLKPWIWGYVARIVYAVVAIGLVIGVPTSPIGLPYFILILTSTVLGSFANTVQFVGISAYHTQIADPLIGGTYMTLFNTFSNLGGTWPKYFVLKAVDWFTISHCASPGVAGKIEDLAQAASKLVGSASSGILEECTSDEGKAKCLAGGGECVIERDGYYITSALCIGAGAALFLLFILPTARKLEALPASAWRVTSGKTAKAA
ncbi:hypothetical protein IE81DRAFT_321833 [Ceraceosorus guamensis]|uniref:MFS general substrate transporter n=1 Tax=Ceraceosorus guamensis TaxID=1522189 RepID=A0A316W2D2_9BASI|nr:hypothetical protein IE81DRAFT_321833 [Ceraceosorus guamensis]PWN43920.1 hypothetical protein IE81DRAFT_321833 [Ceraceosorus guamensis]